mmetsp:Transcript_3863/g.4502  ORF Transcript_3863/g.4502 Transcript_3863/m.4502 type:complete len:239 (+) Transcript_3863:1321-2037(+)
MRQVSDIHVGASGVVALLHNLDHFVAAFVYFDKSEANFALGKFAHLVLNLEAIRGASRVVVTEVADVPAVPWSISDMEGHLDTIFRPSEVKCLVEATLHIFREVAATRRRLRVDISLHTVDIFGKVSHTEALLAVLHVSVSDESDADGEARVSVPDVINYLAKGILRAMNPIEHRACAVKDQAQVKTLRRRSLRGSLFGTHWLQFNCDFGSSRSCSLLGLRSGSHLRDYHLDWRHFGL